MCEEKEACLRSINARQATIDFLDKEADLEYIGALAHNRNNSINWYLEDFGVCLQLEDGMWVDRGTNQ